MTLFRLMLSVLVVALVLNACQKKDPQPQLPTNLVYDGDMETYPWNDWGFGFGSGYVLTNNVNGYAVDYTVEAASSGTHSIRVKSDAIKNDSAFYYLYQRFLGANIPVGSKLTLKAKIKTVNIQGNGISIVTRGDQKLANGQYKEVFFRTTQGTTPITGTNDFKEYTLTLDALPANTDYLYIFLTYIRKTTGTVYFDDVSLTVN